MRTSYSGSVGSSYVSLPFGDGYTPTVNSSGADQDNVHFADLERDAESGTEHAQFRNYASAQGRWLAPDKYLGSYDLNYPQTMNRYAYALNNPMSFLDPSGRDCFDDNGTFGTGTTGFNMIVNGGCNPNAPSQPTSMGCITYGTQGCVPTNCATIYGCDGPPDSGGTGTSGTPPAAASQVSSAPNNGMPKTKGQCALEALNNNKVALGLDVAGVGAGFLPGGDLVVAGAQATTSVASGINGAVQYNGTANSAAGSVLGVLGLPATFTSYAAKAIGVGGKALPGVGAVISGLGALSDAYGTYTDYQSCLAGHS